MSSDQRQQTAYLLVRDNNLYETLVDTRRAPERRRLYGLPVERWRKQLAELNLLKWHHVQPGVSSFADHYVITDEGRAVLARYQEIVTSWRGARGNPMSMGPNVVGWSIAALIAGAIAVAVAYYENKLPIGDKGPTS